MESRSTRIFLIAGVSDLVFVFERVLTNQTPLVSATRDVMIKLRLSALTTDRKFCPCEPRHSNYVLFNIPASHVKWYGPRAKILTLLASAVWTVTQQ